MAQFKSIVFNPLIHLSILFMLVKAHNQQDDIKPEFLAALGNMSVTQGRDISFTCVVNNLGPYKVAWIKSDSKAILAIHTHMVALNPRLSVTHNGHNTWKLHISHVQLDDSGSYMCQVNTDPMSSISGYVNVVVPPDILNQADTDSSMIEGETNEGGSVSLLCQATGVPEPTVQWRREGGKDIVLRGEGREKTLHKHVDGERLTLTQVQRSDMGGYLCIASNGVPPSVSKRYDVNVNFSPSVKAPNVLVGSPVEANVLLQCMVEAFPKPLNGWYKNEGQKIYHTEKYTMTESQINAYTWQMNLTINNLQKSDFGSYVCSSVNALGKSDARVRLQELRLPPKATTTPTPHVHTTPKPRRKQHNNKAGHETGKSASKSDSGLINVIQENELVSGISSEVLTQIPSAKSSNGNMEKGRNSQMPASVPSSKTQQTWISQNSSSRNIVHSILYVVVFTELFLLFRTTLSS
ncbi:lachesin [Culicoides brevitarsis]|uniref:lachesin n=1 Tax=Culicoides brevitarsis TaxID=469753 RepID=UPI00307C7CFC